MAKRISHNNVGETFTLLFTGYTPQQKQKWQLTSFNGVQNALETCTATFTRSSLTPGEYGQTLTAYRLNGRWVYGPTSDAHVLRSVDY